MDRRGGATWGVEFGGAAAGGDVLVFAEGEGGGFFDADHVVFEAEVGVDVFFILEVAGDDAGAVGKGENAAVGGEFMGEVGEQAAAEVFEVLEVGFADF